MGHLGGVLFQCRFRLAPQCKPNQEALRLLLFVDGLFLMLQGIFEILNAFA